MVRINSSTVCDFCEVYGIDPMESLKLYREETGYVLNVKKYGAIIASV